MRKKFVVLSLLFLTHLHAQNLELGKVTIEELKEKVCPIDTSAVAAYIFKNAKIGYDRTGSIYKETSVKLKIYKKEGYNYANISESFFKEIGNDGVKFTEAVTYNLVNGEIVKTKLGKESEFKVDLNKDISVKKISMPEVKEGSIIEYKIVKYTNNVFNLVNFYFQEEIPIKSINLAVEYSDVFYYNKVVSGYLEPNIKSETLTDYNSKYLKNRVTYQLQNVPAMKDEGFVNNINNYRSKIRYELASVKNKMGVTENLSTDWETVTKNIYESDSFSRELLKTGYFESELDAALVGKTNREEKIQTILAFVKEKVKWNGYDGIQTEKGVKEAYKNNTGNSGDINLMLTAMLRYAGFEANPILITTREFLINLYPSLTSHNFVICGVEIENDVIFLDATSKHSLPNILPIRDLNWFGRIIRKNGSSAELSTMPKNISQEVINILGSIDKEGEVTGKIRNKYADYNAFVYREAYSELTKETYIEKLEKRYAGMEVSDFEVKYSQDLSQPVVEEYSFSTTDGVEIIGNKMYFSPMLVFAKKENPFKQEKREYPVDFVYPNQDKFSIGITIPEGYSIESLPESKAIAMPDNLASFKYNISMNDNKIQLQCIFDINEAVMGSEYYVALKNFYKEMVNKQTEKIVLKKI